MKRKSLILITVDCLRGDRLGMRRGGASITPFLDSLARVGVGISHAIVAGVPTYFSFPAIMASRYPLGLGREVLGIAPGEPSLATVLRESGCATAAFLAGNPYLSSRYGYASGFDTFEDFLTPAPGDSPAIQSGQPSGLSSLNRLVRRASSATRFTSALYYEAYFRYCQRRSNREEIDVQRLRPYPPAETLVDRACSWLNSIGNRDFFLWLHFMDAHHPHYPPPEALSAVGATGMSLKRARMVNANWNRREIDAPQLQRFREEILTLYDASVYWVDRQIARLAEALRAAGMWQDTILAVTADHGEEFLEHGARYHSPWNLPEELVRVPLLIRAPGLAPAHLSEGPFSLIHLAPTLLEGMGFSAPGSFQGKSFWREISEGKLPAGETAIAETVEVSDNPTETPSRIHPRVLMVREQRYKLVLHFSQKSDELFDLQEDPAEEGAINGELSRPVRARLLQSAREHLRRSRQARDTKLALRARLRQMRQTAK
jgi:arylsulfatase A-like enzyme